VEFHFEGGIEDFVSYMNENKEPLGKKVIYFEGESDEGYVEVAMQWNGSYQESVFSFANNINTHEGGSHLSGLPLGADAHDQPLRPREGRAQGEGRQPLGEDVREGLTAVISAKLADPQFEGQTKTKLGNPGMEGLRRQRRQHEAGEFLEENPARRARSSARPCRPRRPAPPRARPRT
jgi:DNA gyrase subunit B